MESKSNIRKSKFDKKKWREKKYDKGFRLNKWEEKRQKIILQKYNRTLKKNNATHTSNDDVKERMPSKKNETSGIKTAQLEYRRIVENKKQKKEERLRKKKEIQQALERYKQRKAEVYKKLSKKTKKGQPLMKERLELMLEKVKKNHEVEGNPKQAERKKSSIVSRMKSWNEHSEKNEDFFPFF